MTALHRYSLLIVAALLAAFLGGCTSTQIWASRCETFNPAPLRDAIGAVVNVTSRAAGEIPKARG
jgi:hypothetical protein